MPGSDGRFSSTPRIVDDGKEKPFVPFASVRRIPVQLRCHEGLHGSIPCDAPRSKRRCRRGWDSRDSGRGVWAYAAYWPPIPAISADFRDDFAHFSAYYQLFECNNRAKAGQIAAFRALFAAYRKIMSLSSYTDPPPF